MLNSFEIRIKELQVELESTSSPTIKSLIESSIKLTNYAVNKFTELVAQCENLPVIIKKASDDLNRENEKSLQELESLIEGAKVISALESIDEIQKQANAKITEFCIKRTEEVIKVRNLNHDLNLKAISMGAEMLPEVLFGTIFSEDISSVNYESIKDMISFAVGATPAGPFIGAASTIMGIKNRKKKNASNANSYIESFEGYNAAIVCWANAVDETIKSINLLEKNSYAELNKSIQPTAEAAAD